ncbi:conserved protein of unknown function [Tepidanaerobacter acetatoxydans Re1]|jgi:hypothetical protein|uniref:Uncharacterized protein n=1 Tax=Tepidanaerobacter acetatoxydans (strain DSM 21804 / JCM 16047 / Re1) TaxID=1209989 RepID=F4LTB0_TEPAE|nr:hypothetical protein [Tepidanaerobacter acetatoxydans]AEE92510.1 hypothetical protein TepRe1_2408 [Tepidanaerobacter acetatoxydans Re1]CCP27458.1 conserved protein of unknown function [Tepidanaerobacter acetatoxydans Re1]
MNIDSVLKAHGIGLKKIKDFEVVTAVDNLTFPVIAKRSVSGPAPRVVPEHNEGKYIFYCVSSSIYVYDMKTLDLVQTISSPFPSAHKFNYAFVLDGLVFISGLDRNLNDSYNTVHIYDESTWTKVATLSPAIVDFLDYDASYIYCLTQNPAETTSIFTKINRSTYSVTRKSFTNWSSPHYTRMYPTNCCLVIDFYNSSNRAIIDSKGNIVTSSVDSFLSTNTTFPVNGRTPNIIYGFNYSYKNGWYMANVGYFDIETFALIKSEYIMDDYNLHYTYGYGFTHNKNKTLTLQCSTEFRSHPIDKNGFFIYGTESYKNFRQTGNLSPLYSFEDNKGVVIVGINPDGNQIQCMKTYITVSE